MNTLLQQLIAALLYPGMLTTMLLTLAVIGITQLRAPGGGLSRGFLAALQGKTSLNLALAALLALIAPAFLPWAGSPLATPRLGQLWLAWALLETSFILALMPGLQSLAASSVRAAMREAQLSSAGRIVLWLALGVALWTGDNWQWNIVPARVLALIAAAMALPVALGWGSFAHDWSLTPGGPEAELNRASAELAQWGRAIRATVLLTLIPLLGFPITAGLHWSLHVALTIATTLALAGVGRYINGSTVRQPLNESLRWCYTRALPLALLSGIVLVAMQRWL